jgi:DNA-binding MarR family transcriptional regulator
MAEAFATPRDATSIGELEDILNQLERRENRWAVIHRMAQTLAVPLAPDEIWLLVQLCREATAIQSVGLSNRFGIPRARMDDIAGRLEGAGLIARAPDGSLIVVDAGRQEFDRMVVSYGNRLAQFLERWSPEDHAEVKTMLAAHARALIEDVPVAPTKAS